MQNHPIATIRHTLAHVMAAAVKEIFPDAKFGIGPVIESGFYYDFELPRPLTETDFKEIEKRMRKIIAAQLPVEHLFLSADQAIADAKKTGQRYKAELLEEIKRGERPAIAQEDIEQQKDGRMSFYRIGNFTDLCKGPHVENTRDLPSGAFKLSHLASAYWRGNEKNPQLQRLYAYAFANEKELADFLKMLEESKKRDHKILGPALDLFTFSDLVGAGLPLWTPKGTLLRQLLDDYVWELRKKYGYQRVEIPHITKKELYEKSGHWDKFENDLFKITTREEHLFAMKPMNCPHHTQIYARKQWSYRELPQRYANTTMCYRDEQTGELAGLSRARSFTQDDAHVFCRMSQVKDEFLKVWDIVHRFYGAMGFALRLRLSLHDPKHPDKYLGNPESWKKAEALLREIVEEKKADAFLGIGEAAFYGPKLDFMAKDSLGREWQVATIQLDINMPECFDLTCINERGEKERIVMVHAAIMGSIERFLAVLIEHTAGAFPLWLSPVQVVVLPITDKQNAYATRVAAQLQKEGFRVELNAENETVGKKIRAAEMMKVPYALIIGEKEAKAKKVAVRQRGGNDLGKMALTSLSKRLKKELASRT